jgi:hypothetical protein
MKSGQLFKKLFNVFFGQELNFFEEILIRNWQHCLPRETKVFTLPLQTFTVTPYRVQVAIGTEALEIAFTSPSYM